MFVRRCLRVVYNAMQKQLKDFTPEVDELAEEALEEAHEGAPLLSEFDVEARDAEA